MQASRSFTLHMSPALNESTALQLFECGNAVEIRDGIMFDFYPGLPHTVCVGYQRKQRTFIQPPKMIKCCNKCSMDDWTNVFKWSVVKDYPRHYR